MSFTYLMNLFILNTLPAYTENLKYYITHVVWFHIVTHIWIEWFLEIQLKKHIPPKEIGKLMVFSYKLLGFFSLKSVISPNGECVKLKTHYGVLFLTLFSSEAFVAKKALKASVRTREEWSIFHILGLGNLIVSLGTDCSL